MFLQSGAISEKRSNFLNVLGGVSPQSPSVSLDGVLLGDVLPLYNCGGYGHIEKSEAQSESYSGPASEDNSEFDPKLDKAYILETVLEQLEELGELA